MATQFLLNLLIAFIWMFLSGFSLASFLLGFGVGIVLLLFLDRFLPDTFYLQRVWAFLSLSLLFAKELFLANIEVLKWVYKPTLNMKTGIFALPTDLTKNWEITLLANLITLTPGTLTVSVSPDNQYLYIHTIDLPDVEASIEQIKNTFEKAIQEVTR